ncbi:hypothetical protein [Ramlibacter sp.]|uniref:hypothetical protein n=1 Tax=Ramlibacter sp. TaxID=1917967 RepID=UPI003D0A54D2
MSLHDLPDGLVAVVKRDCPTCVLVEPVLRQLAAAVPGFSVLTQDDPRFPEGLAGVVDDTALERSFALRIETVPTLLHRAAGSETARAIGWHRGEWEALSGIAALGAGLPDQRPGCGSRNADPNIADELAVRLGAVRFDSRTVDLGDDEDEHEACFDRGWTDGLPVVPPTRVRVHRMLQGTQRDPKEVLGLMPSDLEPCTIEKVAINAVMAGCRPEYMPVLIAAVEAVLDEEFALHGVIATTMYIGPIVIVNGPVRKAIGMNSGVNALGQGNRANSTIGRALQLVIRNVGGGKPGGVDRATLGNPGKLGLCFAENEEDSCWAPQSVERGIEPGKSSVTVFAGFGVQGVVDQVSRTPESLVRSFAACLGAMGHPKLWAPFDAMIVVVPEHLRVFREAGWSRERFVAELMALTTIPAEHVLAGAGGMAVGAPESTRGKMLRKLREGGVCVVHAGGGAGLFSAILPGWGPQSQSRITTKEVRH